MLKHCEYRSSEYWASSPGQKTTLCGTGPNSHWLSQLFGTG